MKKTLIAAAFMLLVLFPAAWYLQKDANELSADAYAKPRLALSAEEMAWLGSHQKISVSIRPGWAPVEFLSESNEFRGVSIDYLKRIETMLGIHFDKQHARENLVQEQADVIAAVTSAQAETETRYMLLSKPFLVSPFVIYTRGGDISINSLDDLHGKRVAIFRAGAVARSLAENHPEIELYAADIAEEALEAVLTGKVDAYVGNSVIVNYVARNQGFANIRAAAETPYKSEIYMAVRSDWPLLASALNKALAAIAESERQEILAAWTMRANPVDINYPLVLSISAVSVLLVGVFFFWNRRLNREISERKLVEASLIEEKTKAEEAERLIRQYSNELERLALVAKNTVNGVMITDEEGRTTWVNQAFTNSTGYTLEDMLGRKPGEVLQGEETSREAIRFMSEAIRNKQDFEIELINYKKSGEKFWISLKVAAVVNSGGEHIFIAVQNDVSKQKQYLETIQNNQADLDAVFSLSPDGIVVFDQYHRVSHVNQAFSRLTGLKAKTLLGMHECEFDQAIKKICTDENQYKPCCQLDSSCNQTDQSQPRFDVAENLIRFEIHADSSRVIERSFIETNQLRISRVYYFTDVTQESMLEKMKTEFVTTAAHELRTPMSVIVGYAELLKHRKLSEEVKAEMIQAIHVKSNTVVGLLNELLDVAKMEDRTTKELKLELQPMMPLLKSVADTFIISNNYNRVLLECPEDLPDFYFDAQKVERAISNCLSNAYKFSPSTSVVKMYARLQEKADGREISISVQDEGIGMTAEQLSHVFEKFYRADHSGHIPGTGLGMVLVKEIVAAHGGRVEIQSEYGVGTTVTLHFPVLTAPA